MRLLRSGWQGWLRLLVAVVVIARSVYTLEMGVVFQEVHILVVVRKLVAKGGYFFLLPLKGARSSARQLHLRPDNRVQTMMCL